jgi:hypothetical protein
MAENSLSRSIDAFAMSGSRDLCSKADGPQTAQNRSAAQREQMSGFREGADCN